MYIYIISKGDIGISNNYRFSERILLPLRSGNTQGQETLLAPSADKHTRNYDTESSNHHPFLSTLRSKRLSQSKMKL